MTIAVDSESVCIISREQEFNNILAARAINSWYQPIIDFPTRTILGYEALARGPKDSALHLPNELFRIAEVCGQVRQLELMCVQTAIAGFEAQQLPGKLFINMAAADIDQLDDPESDIGKILFQGERSFDIVLEVSEKYPLVDYERVRKISDYCHSMGLQMAIDDLGSGYSGLRTWAEIRPEFVKIDMHFVQDIDKDGVKREFVNSICEIARGLNCHVIAEGIERPEELDTLRNLGVKIGQGFIFQRPKGNPKPEATELMSVLDAPGNVQVRQLKTRPADTVFGLMQQAKPLTPDVPAEDVNDFFISNPEVTSVPIVEVDKAVGIISRSQILELFSGRFSHQLFGRKPIKQFMNVNPVTVDYQARLEEVSQRITNKNDADLNNDFIVTRDDRYIGVGKVNDLLKSITEYQIRYARYSNPLTMLPGNVPIYEWIDQLLQQQEDFRLAYVDLNNFKPFNDNYGYSRGDEVLVALGDILSNHIDPDKDSVGHIGGDDFVVLFRSDDWQQRCMNMLSSFSTEVKRFYSSEALNEGGIWGHDRQGRHIFFGLLTLAIGVVWPDPARCRSHHEVARLASDAKHQAKLEGANRNFVFQSRRRGPSENSFVRATQSP